MKSLNGLLFIIVGGLVIWIGATGRLPALAAALGMIRQAPGNKGSGGPPSGLDEQHTGLVGDAQTVQQIVNFSDVIGGSSSPATMTPTQGMTNLGVNFYRNVLGTK